MKETKHVALITKLTEATRTGKVEWRPVTPGDYGEFLAVLPGGQTFHLRRNAGEHFGEFWDYWDLEVRDVGDELLDRIRGEAQGAEKEVDAAMAELVASVEDDVASRLDQTIVALEELTKSLR